MYHRENSGSHYYSARVSVPHDLLLYTWLRDATSDQKTRPIDSRHFFFGEARGEATARSFRVSRATRRSEERLSTPVSRIHPRGSGSSVRSHPPPSKRDIPPAGSLKSTDTQLGTSKRRCPTYTCAHGLIHGKLSSYLPYV